MEWNGERDAFLTDLWNAGTPTTEILQRFNGAIDFGQLQRRVNDLKLGPHPQANHKGNHAKGKALIGARRREHLNPVLRNPNADILGDME